MDRKFLIKFAGKNLAARKLRTLLTISAMVIGVSAIVFLVAFAFGLERQVTREITGGDASILIDIGTGNSLIVKINDESIANISKIAAISDIGFVANAAAKEKSFSPNSPIETSLFVASDNYISWSGYELKEGRELKKNSTRETLINESLLERLGGELSPTQIIGRPVLLDIVIPKELTENEEGKFFKDREFRVVGVLKGGGTPGVFIGPENASLFELANFSQLKAKLISQDKVEQARRQVENLGFKTEYIGETVAQVEQVFRFFKLILGSFGLIALIVASLGMFNTLTISLLERTKEVALLKIIGMKQRDIRGIFITEAIAMGVFGGLLGAGVGILLSKIANNIFNNFAVRAGGEPVAIFSFPAWFLAAVIVFTVLVGFLTGLYPARRAARINALDVLRYE